MIVFTLYKLRLKSREVIFLETAAELRTRPLYFVVGFHDTHVVLLVGQFNFFTFIVILC